MLQLQADDNAYQRVKNKLSGGENLIVKDIADVFGYPGVELMILLATSDENKNLVYLLEEIGSLLKRANGKSTNKVD